VVYADRFIPKAEKSKPEEDQKARYFLKAYTVFNVAQCDGLPAGPEAPARTMPELHAAADTLIRNSGARIAVGGNRACYYVELDSIAVPPIEAYEPNAIYWYRTMLHELSHWTGHESRLARKFANAFGSADYAREELVAEMSAAFTCAALGIVPTVRHADYIGSWLRVLRDDNKAIISAASQASKAADLLLSFAAKPAVVPELPLAA
jgi:antirestriction protein ArdC